MEITIPEKQTETTEKTKAPWKVKYFTELVWLKLAAICITLGIIDLIIPTEFGLLIAYLGPIFAILFTFIVEARRTNFNIIQWIGVATMAIFGTWIIWMLGLGPFNQDDTGGSGMVMLLIGPLTALILLICWLVSGLILAYRRKGREALTIIFILSAVVLSVIYMII